jgi:hypothetical protein
MRARSMRPIEEAAVSCERRRRGTGPPAWVPRPPVSRREEHKAQQAVREENVPEPDKHQVNDAARRAYMEIPLLPRSTHLDSEADRKEKGKQRDELAVDEEDDEVFHEAVDCMRRKLPCSTRREHYVVRHPDDVGEEHAIEGEPAENVDVLDAFSGRDRLEKRAGRRNSRHSLGAWNVRELYY